MRTLLSCLLLAAPLLGGDFAGIWTGQIPRGADLQDVAFKFTQDGTTLGGKQYGDYQSARIVEGKVTGDEIAFTVVAAEQSGNQINQTRLRYTGILKGNELELTRQREATTNAGNGGGVQLKGDSKQTFRLKRLF